MKSSIIQELFERIGICKIWESISEQSALKIFFKSTDRDFTANRAKKMLVQHCQNNGEKTVHDICVRTRRRKEAMRWHC